MANIELKIGQLVKLAADYYEAVTLEETQCGQDAHMFVEAGMLTGFLRDRNKLLGQLGGSINVTEQ